MNRTDFYSSTEAAAVMMCTASHVRHLIKQQKLPSYYVGNRAYIPKAAVQEYIRLQTLDVSSTGSQEQPNRQKGKSHEGKDSENHIVEHKRLKEQTKIRVR